MPKNYESGNSSRCAEAHRPECPGRDPLPSTQPAMLKRIDMTAKTSSAIVTRLAIEVVLSTIRAAITKSALFPTTTTTVAATTTGHVPRAIKPEHRSLRTVQRMRPAGVLTNGRATTRTATRVGTHAVTTNDMRGTHGCTGLIRNSRARTVSANCPPAVRSQATDRASRESPAMRLCNIARHAHRKGGVQEH